VTVRRLAAVLLSAGLAASAALAQGLPAAEHARQALAAEAAGQVQAALENWGQAIRLEPNNPDHYRRRAHLYARLKSFTHAQDDLTELIRLRPGDAGAYYLRGSCFEHPPQPTVYDAALADLRAGKKADAFCDRRIADLTEAVRLDPRLGPAYFARAAEYFMSKGDYARALADLDRALELAPPALPRSFLLWMRAEAHAVLAGDYVRAVADHTEALRLDPRMPMALAMRAASYHKLGRLDQAVADYTEAIRLGPQYGWAHLRRAEIYDQLGDAARAAADREQARGLPQEPFAMRPPGR
jgi:tetratricopeptide (TPR) repeat protein